MTRPKYTSQLKKRLVRNMFGDYKLKVASQEGGILTPNKNFK